MTPIVLSSISVLLSCFSVYLSVRLKAKKHPKRVDKFYKDLQQYYEKHLQEGLITTRYDFQRVVEGARKVVDDYESKMDIIYNQC